MACMCGYTEKSAKKYLLYVFLNIGLISVIFARTYFESQHLNQGSVIERKKMLKSPIEKLIRKRRDVENNFISTANISYTQFANDSNNVVFLYWIDASRSTVFILTCHEANTSNIDKRSNRGCMSLANLYLSKDHGRSFENLNKNFPHASTFHSMYTSLLNSSIRLLTDYHNKTLYISEDDGITFKSISLTFSPTYVEFHPTKQGYLAAFDNTARGQEALYVTTDMGKNWKRVAKTVRTFYWGQPGHDKDLSTLFIEAGEVSDRHVKRSLLYFTVFPYHPQNKKLVDPYLGYIHPYSVFVKNEYILAQKFYDDQLYVNHLRPLDGRFVQCDIDYGLKEHRHHIVFSADNQEIVLGVFHGDDIASVFISDSSGQRYHSMKINVIYESVADGVAPKIDFHVVSGMLGTFIANDKERGTLITYDKGYNWRELSVPRSSLQNVAPDYDCSYTSCPLQLHVQVNRDFSDFTSPMMTKNNTPGIILAQGVLGKYSKVGGEMYKRHSVFISTDSGQTWRPGLKSHYGFAILDHGGIIAAVPLRFSVNQKLQLSTDYGKTWHAIDLMKLFANIPAILTDTGSRSQYVNVFGFIQQEQTDPNIQANTWIVWNVNLTSLFSRDCSDSDFEWWSPFSTNKCVLGKRSRYHRRKLDSKCFHGIHHQNLKDVSTCNCTLADFECDVGFTKSGNSCLIDSGGRPKVPQPCFDGDSYLQTQGYRKIAGNQCSGNKKSFFVPKYVDCPPSLPTGLQLLVSHYVFTVNEKVTFNMELDSGYKGTKYFWNFGDGTIEGSITSYDDAKTRNHTYSKSGQYKVTVTASNDAGTTKVSAILFVQEGLEQYRLVVEEPVLVNELCTLRTYPISKTAPQSSNDVHFYKPHYLWTVFPHHPHLSFNSTYNYTFKDPGFHRIEVQIHSNLKVATAVETVLVFVDSVQMQLDLSGNILSVLQSKKRSLIEDKLKIILTMKYHVTDYRVYTKLSSSGLHVTLTLTDTAQSKNSDRSATIIAKELVQTFNEYPSFLMELDGQDISITGARLLPVEAQYGHQSRKPATSWLYAFLTCLVAAVSVVVLGLFWYYRRKERLKRDPDELDANLVVNMDADDTL